MIRFDTEAPILTSEVVFTFSSHGPVVLEQVGLSGTDLTFTIRTESGQSYTVEYNDDLATANWLPLQTILGDGSFHVFRTPWTSATQRFFRVRQP